MTLNINGGKVLAFARRNDPETSREAARETSKRLRKLHREVLQFGFERGTGFTDDQLNAFFGTHSSTYRTRRAELTARGFIEDTGERVGDTGRRHIVWALTSEGRRAHLFGDDGASPPPLAA